MHVLMQTIGAEKIRSDDRSALKLSTDLRPIGIFCIFLLHCTNTNEDRYTNTITDSIRNTKSKQSTNLYNVEMFYIFQLFDRSTAESSHTALWGEMGASIVCKYCKPKQNGNKMGTKMGISIVSQSKNALECIKSRRRKKSEYFCFRLCCHELLLLWVCNALQGFC